LLTGGFWYARNAIVTESPIPTAQLSVGALSLYKSPDPVLEKTGLRVVDYVRDRSFWRKVPTNLDLALGPGWLLLLAAGLGGAVASIARKDAEFRWLSGASIAGGLAYLVTPYSAGGPRGNPWLFPIDTRFAFGSLALGLALLCHSVDRSRVGRRVVCIALGLTAASTLFATRWPVWPPWFGLLALSVTAGTVTSFVVAYATRPAVSRILTRPIRRSRAAVLFGLVAIVAAAALMIGYPIQRRYFRDRYRRGGIVQPQLAAWASHTHGYRIGIVGITYQYPLFGPFLDNDVDYLGERVGSGGFRSLRTCSGLIQAITKRKYDYVVAGHFKSGVESAPEESWLSANPAFQHVITDGDVKVFRLLRRPGIESCGQRQARVEPIEFP
jgi:hypothetical protein